MNDAFVFDFMNDADTIQEAFADYYRTTVLSEETDPNKLHDLKAALDGYQVYADTKIDQLVTLYLDGADRDQLDPILDACVAFYKEQLDEDGQVDFKGKAKAFERAYGFLASILPYTNAEWEKLSIFLNFLVPKLPAPVEEDLSKGILESIDMDSYRVEKKAARHVQLADEDAEIEPVPTNGGGHRPEAELDRLSNILKKMMIFLPLSINMRRLAERSAWPTVAPTWANCLIVSQICRSRMRLSVTTMMESNTPAASFRSPINWWASQAMELDFPLPAECWMRYRFPAPCRRVSASNRRTTLSWW